MQLYGAAYHVTARGAKREPLYRDDADRTRFIDVLAEVIRRHDWSCHAFCLMTTHYHLLIRTPEPDLARGMQRLNGHYAQGFNRRHGEEGHVFYRRYHSVAVEKDAHLLELSRYFALNPVRAGICDEPSEWPWSSYRAMLGLAKPPPFLTVGWLLSHFGTDPRRARARLRDFVEGCDEDRSDTLASRGLTP